MSGYSSRRGGAVLGAVTFVVFGAVLLGPALGHLTTAIVVYALLSLTVVRMLPVAISLPARAPGRRPSASSAGSGHAASPRSSSPCCSDEGSDLPHEQTLLVTIYVTVAFSVLLHGLTAAPLAARYAGWFAAHPRDQRPATEAVVRRRISRWRHSHRARRPG